MSDPMADADVALPPQPDKWKFRTAASLPMQANFNDEEDASSIGRWLARGFRVDLSPNLFGGESLDQRLLHFESRLRGPNGAALLSASRASSLDFSNCLTGADIIQMCSYSGMSNYADGIIFVMKMGVALASCGYCSIENELLLKAICDGAGLPLNKIDHGPGRLHASFGTAPPLFVRTNSGVQSDKLIACVELAMFVSSGTADIQAAIFVLDEILARRKPYGQFVHMTAFHCVCTCASVTIRMGTWEDALATALITPFVIFTLKLCKHGVKVADMVDFMVPFATGLGASFVWRFVDQTSECHVPTWLLSVLIDFLPGSSLVYAAYEFEFSSIINSTSRLVRALLQCMLLAVGIVAGWQTFGHDLHIQSHVAGMPPAVECNDLEYKRNHWKLAYFGLNVPMVFALVVGTNIRLRDTVGPFFICYVSLLAYGWMTWSGAVSFPAVVTNVICCFIAGNLASALECAVGSPPAMVSVLPLILFLAPGGPCVKSILQGLRNTQDQGVSHADLWQGLVLEGLSYAVGLHLSVSMWRTMVFKRARQRVAAAKTVQGLDMPLLVN